MRTVNLSLALIGLLCGLAGQASAQTARNAVSVGAGLHPLGSAVPVVQYEYLLNDRLSIGGKYIGLEYTYDDDSYHETGDGQGAEVLVTYHFRGQGHQGPYFAAGLGYFDVDWDWKDPGTGGPQSGRGSTKGAEVSASFGWKFPLGRSFYIDPSITAGNFFGSGKDSTGSRESELGAYGAVMVKVGMTF